MAAPRAAPPPSHGPLTRSRNGLQMHTCALSTVPEDAGMTLDDRAKLFKIMDAAEGMWSPNATVVEHKNPQCWKLVFTIEAAVALTNLSQLFVGFFDNITNVEVAWSPTLRVIVTTTRGAERVPTPKFVFEARLRSDLGTILDKADRRVFPDNWDALKPRLVALSTLLYNQERTVDYRTMDVTAHPTQGTATLHSIGMATVNYPFLCALSRAANICMLTATTSSDGSVLNIRVSEGEPVPWREIGAPKINETANGAQKRAMGDGAASGRPLKRARD